MRRIVFFIATLGITTALFAAPAQPATQPVVSNALKRIVSVESFTPQGEAYPVRQVQVRFSEPVVRFGQNNLSNPFRIGCAIPGKGRWVDTRNWVYDFDKDLPAGIACQFVPVSGLVTPSGRSVAEQPVYRFQTAAPAVVDMRPYEDDSAIDENQVFLLKFDGENDRRSLVADTYCLIEGIKERVPLKFLTVEETKAVVADLPDYYQSWWAERATHPEQRAVSCSRSLPPGAKVKLVFAKGMRSATGVVRKEEQVLPFKVRAAFSAMFRCVRENARQGCAPTLPMRLEFTEQVSPEFLSAIRLEANGKVWKPESNHESGEGYSGEGYEAADSISFTAPFPPLTNFSLSLPAGLKDISGRTLNNAVRFPLQVKTANYPPLAKFSASIGVIEAESGAVPLTLRSLEPAGIATEAKLFTLKLPDSDSELLRWLGRFAAHQQEQDCFRCGDRDDNNQLLKPDPRSQSVIARNRLAEARVLPRQLPAKEFEVVGIPVDKGVYIHEVESRYLGDALMDNKLPLYVSSLSIVTNLGVHLRNGPQGGLVWVTTLDKGQPVPSAEVAIHDCKTQTIIWQGKTDKNGIANFHVSQDLDDYDDSCMGRYAVIARSGNDRALVLPRWNEGIESWRFNLSGWQKTGDIVAHTILDRSLLRVGETLHMRHIVRSLSLDGLVSPQRPEYKRLYIMHEGSGQKYELPLSLDAKGNGESEWKVPRTAKLGHYEIYLERKNGQEKLASFRVEEFRLPVLKARFQVGGTTIAPSRLPLDMQLHYLNGGGYANAPVTIRGRISKASFNPDGYDEYVFSQRENASEEMSSPITLAEQQITLDANGGKRVESQPLPDVKAISRLALEMAYRDPSGEVHTATANTLLWPAAVVPGIKLPDYINTKIDKDAAFEIITLDQQGKPKGQTAVEIKAFVKTSQSHRRRTVGGFYAYETVIKEKPVSLSCGPRTNAAGRLICSLAGIKDAGELVIRATAQDAQGRTLSSSASVWVSGKSRWWFDQGNDDRIDLIPVKKEYEAGENLQLQVRMPFPEATALISIERDGILESFVQTLRSDRAIIELPVKAKYAPNIFISAFLVRGRNNAVAPTALVDLGKPAFKLGIAEVNVGWAPFRFGVRVTANKSRYQPRENAEVDVQVTPPANQTLAKGTEVTLAVVDESLLELASNPTWDVLAPMMSTRGYAMDTATSQLQVVGKRHYGRKAVAPGGSGGRGGATRELFDTLVYWQGRAAVDTQGKVHFSFPLNDSLSKFRIVAVASSESRFGTGETTIESGQEISLLSGLSLVVRQGDKLDPAFTLRNSGKETQTLNFRAELKGKGVLLEKTMTVPAGESVQIPVSFTVPANVEQLEWLASASNSTLSDSVRLTQKVLDPVPERVLQSTLFALTDMVDIPVKKPENMLSGGAIQISGQARLADGTDALKEWFKAYPYSCMEQQTSRAVGLQDRKRWDELMELLSAYVDSNGLVAFYPNTQGYPFLTAYLLHVSRLTGWPLPEESRQQMLDGLKNYVEGRSTVDDWQLQTFDEEYRRLDAILALARHGKFNAAWLDTLKLQSSSRWPTAMLVNWLELLKIQNNIPQHVQRLAQTEQQIRARLNLQGSALLLSEGRQTRWWLYDNSEATVARLMLATMSLPNWQEDQPRLLRGLLMLQQGGHWQTTVANLWGTLALKAFSQRFEQEAVTGQTALQLTNQKQALDWTEKNPEPVRMAWPEQPTTLKIVQEGTGNPWITVQSRARITLEKPESTGLSVSKAIKPLQQKTAGKWSVGDVLQVRLHMKAQSDIGWVVVDDPIPAGSTLLGRALGRDGSLAADNANEWTWATYAEFGADSYRAYYERIAKGEWEATYVLRLNQSGDFRLPPTKVEALYAPEMQGVTPNTNWIVNP